MNFASIPSISPITGYGSVPIERLVTYTRIVFIQRKRPTAPWK